MKKNSHNNDASFSGNSVDELEQDNVLTDGTIDVSNNGSLNENAQDVEPLSPQAEYRKIAEQKRQERIDRIKHELLNGSLTDNEKSISPSTPSNKETFTETTNNIDTHDTQNSQRTTNTIEPTNEDTKEEDKNKSKSQFDQLVEQFANTSMLDFNMSIVKAMKNVEKRDKQFSRKSRRDKSHTHDGHRKRLRKRAMFDETTSTMTDDELLEVLLSFATPRKDVHETAREMLKGRTLNDVLDDTPSATEGVKNVTANAKKLVSAIGAAGVVHTEYELRLNNPDDTAEYLYLLTKNDDEHVSHVVYLDENCKVIEHELHADDRIFNARQVVGGVYKYGARGVILARKAPELIPPDDDSLYNIEATLDVMGTKLLDCFMFGDDGYYTFAKTKHVYGVFVFMPYKTFNSSLELNEKLDTTDFTEALNELDQLAELFKNIDDDNEEKLLKFNEP